MYLNGRMSCMFCQSTSWRSVSEEAGQCFPKFIHVYLFNTFYCHEMASSQNRATTMYSQLEAKRKLIINQWIEGETHFQTPILSRRSGPKTKNNKTHVDQIPNCLVNPQGFWWQLSTERIPWLSWEDHR